MVVHHDPDLADGTPISSRTFADLSTSEVAVDRLPTLAEVCALVQGRVELYVEIKAPGIENLVTAALATYAGAVAIHSFDHGLIGRLAAARTPYRLGVLVEGKTTNVPDLMRRTGALDVWPEYSLVDAGVVGDVHLAGGRVLAWTVNDIAEGQRLASLGVDGICTDDVTMFERM